MYLFIWRFLHLLQGRRRVRHQLIAQAGTEATAERFGITLHGGNGVIGALGAVALAGLPHEILLDPTREIP